MGTELTGAGLLLRTLVLRRLLRREVIAPDEQFVGVILPPSVPAVVVIVVILWLLSVFGIIGSMPGVLHMGR